MCKSFIGPGAAAVALTLAACSGAGTPSSQSSQPAGKSSSPNQYCALSRSYVEKYQQAPTPGDSPQAIREVYQEAARDIRAALAVAPPEIHADVATVADGLDRLLAVLERFDYDGARLAQSPDALNGIDTQQFEEAGHRVEVYIRDECR